MYTTENKTKETNYQINSKKITDVVQGDKGKKLAIAVGNDFGSNLRELEEQGYATFVVSSGQELIEKILSYQPGVPFESLVILSHGYTGGIVGQEGVSNRGVYNEFAWLDNARDEGEEHYEYNEGEERRELTLLDEVFVPEEGGALDYAWAYAEAFKNETDAINTGENLIRAKGARTVDELAESIKASGFTVDGEMVLGGCNLGIRDDVANYLFKKEWNNDGKQYEPYDYDPGGFAGDLSRLIDFPVVASSRVLKGDYYVTGKTQPYPKKQRSTSKRQASTGGWSVFLPDGSNHSINEDQSVLDLSNPYKNYVPPKELKD